MTKLFIPTTIKVGFQARKDTFTGKLAYVIYFDEKGKLRKEASWNSWCDKKIEALEFENTPRNNYVFNKGVQRYSDWGSGRSVIRVHDPRNFEFEISVDNLVGILMHSDVSKRDIVEECVFAWAGPELVLLPVNSQEYQDSVKYTEKQSEKVSAKSLKPGIIYSAKKNDGQYTYIGYYPYYERGSYFYSGQTDKGKRHVFYDGNSFVIPAVGTLAHAVTDEAVENYADLVDKFFASSHSGKIVSIKTKAKKDYIVRDVNYYDNVQYAAKSISDTEFVLIRQWRSAYQYYGSRDPGFVKTFDIKDVSPEVVRLGQENKQLKFIVISDEKRSAYRAKNNHNGYYNSYWDRNTTMEATFNEQNVPYTTELKNKFIELNGANVDLTKLTDVMVNEAIKALGYGKLLLVNEHGKTEEYTY